MNRMSVINRSLDFEVEFAKAACVFVALATQVATILGIN